MPTLEQAQKIHHDIQTVNDDPAYFPTAQANLDHIADGMMLPNGEHDAWQAYRFRRLICTSTLSHLTAMAAIELVGPESDIVVPDGVSAYDAYLQHTADTDSTVVQKVYNELQDGHVFTPVYERFATQLEDYNAVVARHKDRIRKQGKVASPLGECKTKGEQVFNGQFTGNAASLSMSLVTESAMLLACTKGVLPEPEEITRLSLQDGGWERLLSVTTVDGQTSAHYRIGREASQRWYKDNLSAKHDEAPVSPKSDWNEILREYIEVGTLSVLAKSIGSHLMHSMGAFPKRNMRGHCGGSFPVRPYEPYTDGRQRERAEAFFADRGVQLQDGAFNAVGYQLIRGFKVAERTLFSDPTYRAAMEEIATNIRRTTLES